MRRPWRYRWSLLLAAPLLAGVAGFAWFLVSAARPPALPARPADGLVVLTGGAERVESGLRLLAEGQARRLLISGVHPQVSLAELARAAGQEPAALEGRVTLGHRATSTRGNAAEIAEWAAAAELRSLVVVTAGYHMPRALLELRRRLPGVALLPYPVQPPQLRDPAAGGQTRTWILLAGEYAKLLGAIAGVPALLEPAPFARPHRPG
jgi:uncharacterized SAM-binding protein YcdF (DUF218 family)